MRRVLKPGGCLAVSTWRVAQGADLHPVLKEMGIPRRSHNPGWITEPDILEALIHRNGFTDISVKMDSMDFRYTCRNRYFISIGACRCGALRKGIVS